MNRSLPCLVTAVCVASVSVLGCRSVDDPIVPPADYRPFVQQIEYPDAQTPTPLHSPDDFAPPPTLSNFDELEAWPLSLDDAIRLALQNSDVMRDLGGRVLTTPAAVSTAYDPALQETNPLGGVEAALSAFDAQLGVGLVFDRTENKFNNLFFGGGAASLARNTAGFNAGVSKTTAAGTQFAFRNITDYDRNTSPINRFHSVYNTLFQAEVRHPLLQGAGVEFNRIAGPSRIPGVYNGVLVARINTDITLAQFETAVRDLLASVEQTYWQLHQAYRELDTRQRARHAAGLIWREEKLRLEAGQARPDDEAQARQRYHAFQSQVENALTGSSQNVGVFSSERNLRRLLGLPPADGRVIRPLTPPTTAQVVFDWRQSIMEALHRRVELRQQRWLVRRRELESRAASNYAKARLDFVSQYGWKGFGDQLAGNRNVPEGSAFADLFGGDLQDWRMGLELTTPIGNRVGHTAVRNAQLQLARERAVLKDQEQLVSHQLAGAIAEMERALANVNSTANSRNAALEQVRTILARAGETERVFFLLDAQQRLADAESAMHRAVTDYNLALLDVEYRRGTLLSYMDVTLTEGPWTPAAHESAARQMRKLTPRVHRPIPADHIKVSDGAFGQPRPITAMADQYPPRVMVESIAPGSANAASRNDGNDGNEKGSSGEGGELREPGSQLPQPMPKPTDQTHRRPTIPNHVVPLSYQPPAAATERLPAP